MGKVKFSEPLFLLDLIGLNPLKNDKYSRIRRYFYVSLVTVTVISGILELFLNFQGIQTVIRASEIVFPEYQAVWKTSILILYRAELAQLIVDCDQFWPLNAFGYNHYIATEAIHKWLRQFFFFYRIMMMVTATQFTICSILYDFGHAPFLSYGEDFEGLVSYKIYVILSQIAYLYLATLAIAGFDGLFFYLIGHVLSELAMVRIGFGRDPIRKVWDETFRFRCSVQHHSFVLRYIKLMNNSFGMLLLNQHLSSLFGICFGLFFMSKDGMPPDSQHVTHYSFYILSYIFQIFTYCFAGSFIIDSSLQIPDAVFHGIWTGPRKLVDRLAKIAVIQRAQKPAGLTLGGYGSLDLESFNLVIKNALSFFTFMNALYETSS